MRAMSLAIALLIGSVATAFAQVAGHATSPPFIAGAPMDQTPAPGADPYGPKLSVGLEMMAPHQTQDHASLRSSTR
jgi:hypothetical protein